MLIAQGDKSLTFTDNGPLFALVTWKELWKLPIQKQLLNKNTFLESKWALIQFNA